MITEQKFIKTKDRVRESLERFAFENIGGQITINIGRDGNIEIAETRKTII